MMTIRDMVLAVPSNGAGGLDAERSGHFGRCDCFTLVEVVGGAVGPVTTLANMPHVEGGCMRPVQLLADAGVSAIVVAGIGGRPLAGFSEAGITVYSDNTMPRVGDVVEAVVAGSVGFMEPGCACGGH